MIMELIKHICKKYKHCSNSGICPFYDRTYGECPNCKKNAREVKMREIDKKAEESTYKDVESKGKPKVCYDIGCIYHIIGVDSCKLAFPAGTSFEKMLNCPYRMPTPLANIGYDFGEGSK